MSVFLRILIGGVLLASGVEKALSPYQNFLYVIQAYQLFPSWLEKIAAIGVPWVELLVGLFLILGLWIRISLQMALVLFGCFVVIVSQALFRGLPIDQCGCFGENIHIPPQVILVFDSCVVLVLSWLLKNPSQIHRFSLDSKFSS